jgi:hypothetical protein
MWISNLNLLTSPGCSLRSRRSLDWAWREATPTGILWPMRSCIRSILVIMILGSASAGLAQEPDAGAQPAEDAGETKQEPAAKVDGESDAGDVAEIPPRVARESGSFGKEFEDD